VPASWFARPAAAPPPVAWRPVGHFLTTERLVLRPVTAPDHAALGPLGLTEVLAEVDEGNAASAAVFRRLGMTRSRSCPACRAP